MPTVNETGANEGVVLSTSEVDEAPTTSPDDEEIARLRSKGQVYKENENDWRFFLRSYEGGSDYIDGDTLFRHAREQQSDFDRRLARAHYQNYCQPLVDFVPEYIFSQDVERSAPRDLEETYSAFKENCDRAGTSLNAFMQAVGEDIRIFGMVFIQVDKPANTDANLSVLEAKKRGLDVPYLVLIRPLEVFDHRMDPRGNLTYVKRVECLSVEDGDGWKEVERYTEWRADRYDITEIDVTDPQQPVLGQKISKPNPWGVVPMELSFYKRKKSDRRVGQAFLQDIALQNRAVFNQTSLIDEFLYRQCFNILARPTSNTNGIPFRDQTEGQIGTGNVMDVPNDAKFLPEYITPPSDPAQFIQSERETTIREMYRQAAQDLMSEMMSPGRNSGDSAKQAFSRTIPVINKTADSLQHTELRVMKLWAKLQRKDWKDGKISYKDDYSVTSLLDLLTTLTMIFNDIRLFSPTFIKEEWKRLVREFDGKIDPKTMQAIIKEIDKLTEKELKDIYASAADRKAAAGLPSTANMVQGKKQSTLGTDKRIAGATGSRAATKETLPDANKRSTKSSRQ